MSLILLAACVAVAAVQFATFGLAVHRLRAARGPLPSPRQLPPVSIIRPVCGLEHRLEETLLSGFLLDYPYFEIVFCVEEADDAAIPLLHRLIAGHPHVPARLLVGDDRIGINPKLNNVIKGYDAARNDFLMMVDSNVVMRQDCIQRVLADWNERTGTISAPGIGIDPRGVAAEIECAFLNTYQARWLLAGDRLGLGYAQGKMMLFRRSDLELAGGLAALADEVAEDSGLTKSVRRLGLDVRMSAVPFLHPVGRRRLSEVWARQLRWAKLRRACFPRIYVSEIIACPLVPVGLAAAFAASSGLSFGWVVVLAASLYAGEGLVAAIAGWHLKLLSPVSWVMRDLLIPPLWLLGWSGAGFEWRGHGMDIDADDTSVAGVVQPRSSSTDAARQ